AHPHAPRLVSSLLPRAPRSPLFPYTTLFRSDGLDEKSREKLSALGYVASGKTSPPTSIDPKDRIDVANDMHDASLAIEEGKEATVIPLLLRVVAKDPQIQAAQYYLGIAYSRRGNFAKAIPPLHKAVELRPDALMAQY